MKGRISPMLRWVLDRDPKAFYRAMSDYRRSNGREDVAFEVDGKKLVIPRRKAFEHPDFKKPKRNLLQILFGN